MHGSRGRDAMTHVTSSGSPGQNAGAVLRDSGRLPALDGVRGLAVLLVFVYHAVRQLPYTAGPEALVHRIVNAGWIGVDLFFVLSGFLITGILLEAKGSPSYFRTFYVRRVLRIVPVYLVFLAVILWVAPAAALATPAQAAAMRDAQSWYWTHTVNLMIARSGWGAGSWHSGHIWSLSLEEQFYILWPALVFVLSRRGLVRATIAIVAGVSIARAVMVGIDVSSTAIYVLLPTRMDSLATGALLAALSRDVDAWSRVRRWAAPAAIGAAVVLTTVFYRDSLLHSAITTQVVGYPMLAVLSGALVVSAVDESACSRTARFWSHPMLRLLGRYSYGLYIWHVLVIALLHERVYVYSGLDVMAGSHLPGYILFTGLALAVSLGVALASWYCVEAPFLALKRYVPSAAVYVRRSSAAVIPNFDSEAIRVVRRFARSSRRMQQRSGT
jgi:peptidoglycan/LPS O-acetylase OafA/YrhL